jgi:hypothetical protein
MRIKRNTKGVHIMGEDLLKDFFISYAHENWEWAKWINQQLEEAGYSTVLPARDFLAGRNFILEIDKATYAGRTIAVLSPQYLTSQFTKLEWTAALRLDPTGARGLLLPVRVLPCDVQGVLAQLIYIDLIGAGQDKEKARKILLAGVLDTPKKLKPAAFPSPLAPNQTSVSGPPPAMEHIHASPERFGKRFPKFWNVPRRHVPYFTGRNEQIQQIFQRLVVKDAAQVGIPQALVGLGGLGKTQTAAEYAYRYREEYQAVLWVRAETKENLTDDFRSFVRLLNLPEQENPIETMSAWFRENAGWLLILDNADDFNLIDPFLPHSPRGHVLLTTRVRASNSVARPLLLEPLSPEDGALCIIRRIGSIPENGQLSDVSTRGVEAAINLSRLMDGLPLALEQAGAYIDDTGSSVSRYLELYEKRRAEIIQYHHGVLPNYPLPVATAWTFSRSNVKQGEPAAFEFLQLCAFIAPEEIPDEIFIKGATALGPVLEPIAADPAAINRVAKVLRNYSLLNREVKGEEDISRFSLHRMMQEILRDEMDEATQQRWAERAVRAISLALPFVEREIMQAHVRHCIPFIEKWNMTFPEAERVRQYIGN